MSRGGTLQCGSGSAGTRRSSAGHAAAGSAEALRGQEAAEDPSKVAWKRRLCGRREESKLEVENKTVG